MAANKIVEDYLDEDDAISGQKYALVSFISPEAVLEKKELFFFQKFLQAYEVEWKVKGLEGFLGERVTAINRELEEKAAALEKAGQGEVAEICRRNRIKIDAVFEDCHAFIRQKQRDLTKTKIVEAWDDFLFKEQAKLEEEYHAKNNFQTSIRGFKVRAVARDEKEAEVRAKKLQASDKYHNIFCAEVGKWTPWDPKTHMIENQEYAQQELNALMKGYKENEDHKATFFDEQRKAGIKDSKESKEGEAGKPKKLFGVTHATEEDAADAASAASTNTVVNAVIADAAAAAVQNTLFSGPADLVMERKAQNAAAAATSTPVVVAEAPVNAE